MGFQQASAGTVTVTTGNITASAGDVILVFVRETIATPATPSGSGLTAFTLQTLTAGTADNGAGTVRGAWYRTLVSGAFNDTLSFANSAFGYAVYVYSGLDTGGTNASNAIVQAVGHFDDVQDNPATITYTSPITSGNYGVCGWIGYQPIATPLPTTPGTGWTTDSELYDAGGVWVVGQSRSTTTSTAAITFNFATQVTHGVALELQVSAPPPSSAFTPVGLFQSRVI